MAVRKHVKNNIGVCCDRQVIKICRMKSKGRDGKSEQNNIKTKHTLNYSNEGVHYFDYSEVFKMIMIDRENLGCAELLFQQHINVNKMIISTNMMKNK